jgi:hypothetical protein
MMETGNRWVTLFGFAQNSQLLLSVKAQVEKLLGSEIVETRTPAGLGAGTGNYVHVQFASAAEARNALQLNGHLLEGEQLMLGVVPYHLGGAQLGGLSQAMGGNRVMTATSSETAQKGGKRANNEGSSPASNVLEPLWRLLDVLFDH